MYFGGFGTNTQTYPERKVAVPASIYIESASKELPVVSLLDFWEHCHL